MLQTPFPGAAGRSASRMTGFPSRVAAASLVALMAGAAMAQNVPAAPAQNAVAPPAAAPWCGTHEMHLAMMQELGLDAGECVEYGPCDQPGERDAWIPTAETPIKTIQLMIHIFCEKTGKNCAATLDDVDIAVARLNADFLPHRFQFVAQSRFVNNTTFRYLDPWTEQLSMKKFHVIEPESMLNIYVTSTTTPEGSISWATMPWNPSATGQYGGIVIHAPRFVISSSNPTVLTHEVGHCLGLHHTFLGVDEVDPCGDCYEFAGRPPEVGDITGDRCSDTNPTPLIMDDPTKLDPCTGLPWLDPPLHNYMSAPRFGPTEFTPQQAGRMHCWTDAKLSGWLTSPPPPPPPAAPGAPSLLSLGGGVVGIAWVDNSGDEDGFRIERERKQGKNWRDATIVATVPADTTSTTDAPGAGTFRYRVQAFNAASGDSSWSGWTQIDN